MIPKILFVEDDESLRAILTEAMAYEGYDPKGVASAEEAAKILASERFDVLVTDINLPGKSGLELLPICTQLSPQTYKLVMTAHATIDAAVQAMKLGAADFLCKPISLNDLSCAIKVAVERINNRSFASQPTGKLDVTSSSLVGASRAMTEVLHQIETVAPYKASVLITGETGTGKELIAKEIHQKSPRARNAFVALNCAAVPEQLLEDELFGHVKGAFTGAQSDRKGRFEQADGGTLFLDEIGDMNLALQSKLLRVLQESEFERLGSSRVVKVDVRVVAATSANIERRIESGEFRPDLYHRLNVVRLRVPPLRDRASDVPILAEHLLNRFCADSGLPAKIISAEALEALQNYDFPGNVRQLQNAMERAGIFSGAETEIRLEHLPEEIRGSNYKFAHTSFQSAPVVPDEGLDFSGVVSQLERDLLMQTLDKTGGNKMRAAKLLNMKRTTLVEKLKRLNIETDAEAENESE